MLTKNTEQLKQHVAEHVAADSVIQGDYWDTETLRGCFIGCLAHSSDPSINEATYGLSIAVQRIAENIFETLSADEAKAFFAALPDAVGCDGKDLSRVHWQFLAAELRSLPSQPSNFQAVIDPVIVGMDLLAAGSQWPPAALAAARAAIRAAIRAADADTDTAAALAALAAALAAARAADRADDRADDRGADRGAALQAADAANAAANAAWTAADAARRRQRDLLLRLIADAPVVEDVND